jgi:putative CocE/NonD family hydrolase
MRDGIKLATDVYTLEPGKRQPVLLMRTPYNKSSGQKTAELYARSGYTVVVQDCRGRYASGGNFLPYNTEGQDGFDTLEWITKQPWSNGQTGMWGASYVGAVQWQAAAEKAYGLAVLAPTATWSSFYRNVYLGGTVRLALVCQAAASLEPPPPPLASPSDWSRTLMHLPLMNMESAIGWPLPWLTGILTHNRPDGYWKRLDLTKDLDALEIPAQHVVGYYDFFCRETVASFLKMRAHSATRQARQNQQLILGPWDHGTIGKTKVGDVDFGPGAELDLPKENLAWFDRFLKIDASAMTKPFSAVRYFSMGNDVWKTAEDWPPPNVQHTWFYLHSDGRANSRRGSGRLDKLPPKAFEPSDSLQADPADPVPAVLETDSRPRYSATWGPVDQGPIEDRQDVLVYSTESLKAPLTFAGPLRAELHVSTDSPDSDWVVKVIDVRPDGFAQNLAVGILRSSTRESELRPKPLVPGENYQIKVDLGHVAAKIERRHSLRVEVTWSYFPLFDRNTNTGEGPTGSRTRVATQTLLHSRRSSSRILLPIIQ